MRRSLLAIAAAGALVLAACGGDDDDDSGGATTTAAGAATTAAAATTTAGGATTTAGGATTTEGGGGAVEPSNIQASGKCAEGTGEAASGDPIKIGGLATNVPGIDFTWITGMTKAYFDCVNDNGGIGGRPIEYIAEEEQIDPQQIAALATKLIETDGVVGLVGNTSIIDCSVNQAYYESKGFYPIIAGVDQACFTSPNFSAVNMGPYYSSLGGAQAAVRAGAENKIVVVSPNQPGFDLINSGVVEYAEAGEHGGPEHPRGRAHQRPGRARPAARAGGRRGRRGGARLHGSRGASAAAGHRAAGPRRLGHLGQLHAAQRPVAGRRAHARHGTRSSSSTPSSTCSTRACPTRTT